MKPDRAPLRMPTILLAILLLTALLLAWGPGQHLEFAERVWRRRREMLPRDVALLLSEEREAYYYGNLAADIIHFKSYRGAYSHCHKWTIIGVMRERATTPREEAFILGYLSHLAADTIAHNHFVPYHLARYARTRGLGHLYWEMNADRFVPVARWGIVSDLRSRPELTDLDELINDAVPEKALSMATNKMIFNHVLLVSEREQWRRGVARIHPIGDVGLRKGFLAIFQDAAVGRIRLALHPRGLREISCVDPNGREAQKSAMRARTRLVHRIVPRRMKIEESEEIAAGFLLGMESPPPQAQRQAG